MNSVTIVGRAGKDPEMKYFDSGKARTTFSMAVSRWDSKTSAEITDWFNIELWDKTAETAGTYVKKGSLLLIDGRLRVNKFTGKDGQEREYYSIVGNRMRLLGKRAE